MSIPAWKVRREIARVGQQVHGLPEIIFGAGRRKQYDNNRDKLLKTENGVIPSGPKVVLVLLYQPNGVAQSVYWTLEHFRNRGYAPLVVSNGPMVLCDKEKLLSRCWKLVERPNYGYDFGGYRDGIWLLWKWGVTPENLIIINDSIWFPLDKNETIITRMEENPADYVGVQLMEPPSAKRIFRRAVPPFFGSYLFMIKKPVFEHKVFEQFWKGYRQTSNKDKTIRRGERDFYGKLVKAGITWDALYDRRLMGAFLATLSQSRLKVVLKNLICIKPDLERDRDELISSDEAPAPWVKKALELIQHATDGQYTLAALPVIAMSQLDYSLVKKTNTWCHNLGRRQLIEAIENGTMPRPPEVIYQELVKSIL